ncbi:hypothetical protein [Undibacterium danionis]|uniref:Uncharacterized protein n=1 Tax=Undibacterium danionis TaxID=1812100 RepID=A0ABV6IC41_9BURK
MQTDSKARKVMYVLSTLFAIAAVVSLLSGGISVTSLLLVAFTFLVLFLAVTTPKQLQDFMDILSD